MGGAAKSISKAVNDVGKTVSKAANDTFKTASKAVSDTTEVSKAVVGSAVRDQATIFSGGLSESFGVGNSIQSSFGGNQSIQNASGLWNGLNATGRKIGIATGTAGLAQNFMNQAPPPQQIISNYTGGQNMDLLKQLGDLGGFVESQAENWAKSEIGKIFNPTGSTAKKSPNSLTGSSEKTPMPETEDQKTKRYLMYGGIGIGVVVLLAFLFKRK